MTSEYGPKFNTPHASESDSDIYPAMQSIKHAQRMAFFDIFLSIAPKNYEESHHQLLAILAEAINNDDYVGGPAYDLIEQISPGITPRISDRMDQIITHIAHKQSGLSSLDDTYR